MAVNLDELWNETKPTGGSNLDNLWNEVKPAGPDSRLSGYHVTTGAKFHGGQAGEYDISGMKSLPELQKAAQDLSSKGFHVYVHWGVKNGLDQFGHHASAPSLHIADSAVVPKSGKYGSSWMEAEARRHPGFAYLAGGVNPFAETFNQQAEIEKGRTREMIGAGASAAIGLPGLKAAIRDTIGAQMGDPGAIARNQQRGNEVMASSKRLGGQVGAFGLRAVATAGRIANPPSLRFGPQGTSLPPREIGTLPTPPLNPPGVIIPGNIDLNNRPIIHNPDGSYSTVNSMTFEADGKFILVPGVNDKRKLTTDEAWQQYKQTGKHLGIFGSNAAAEVYANQLHNEQAKQYDMPSPLAQAMTPMTAKDIPGLVNWIPGALGNMLSPEIWKGNVEPLGAGVLALQMLHGGGKGLSALAKPRLPAESMPLTEAPPVVEAVKPHPVSEAFRQEIVKGKTPMEAAIAEVTPKAEAIESEYRALGDWSHIDRQKTLIARVAKKHGVDPVELRKQVLWEATPSVDIAQERLLKGKELSDVTYRTEGPVSELVMPAAHKAGVELTQKTYDGFVKRAGELLREGKANRQILGILTEEMKRPVEAKGLITREEARQTEGYKYWVDNDIHTKPVAESLAIIDSVDPIEHMEGGTKGPRLTPWNARTQSGKWLGKPTDIHAYARELEARQLIPPPPAPVEPAPSGAVSSDLTSEDIAQAVENPQLRPDVDRYLRENGYPPMNWAKEAKKSKPSEAADLQAATEAYTSRGGAPSTAESPPVQEAIPAGLGESGKARIGLIPDVAATGETLHRAASNAAEIVRVIHDVVNPAGVSENAGGMARLLRSESGVSKLEALRLRLARRPIHKEFAKLSRNDQLDFINKIETAEPHKTAWLQERAAEQSEAYKLMEETERRMFPDMGHVENYFPHNIFTDAKKAADFVRRRLAGETPAEIMATSRRPFKLGAGTGFTKTRTGPPTFLELVREMEDAGIKLKETNPETLFQARMHQHTRAILANDLLTKAAAQKLLVPVIPNMRKGLTIIRDDVGSYVSQDTLRKLADEAIAEPALWQELKDGGNTGTAGKMIRTLWNIRPGFKAVRAQMNSIRAAMKAGLIKEQQFRTPGDWLKTADINDLAALGEQTAHKTAGEITWAVGAEPAVAKVINNHFMPGWNGQTWYDTLRGANNAVIQLRLGLSGFHAITTGVDTLFSTSGLGLRQFGTKGERVAGAVNIARGFTGPLEVGRVVARGMKGKKALAGQTPLEQLPRELQAYPGHGGTLEMTAEYYSRFWEQAMEHAKRGELLHFAVKLPLGLVEQVAKPMFNQWVPALKLGVFMDEARFIYRRLDRGELTPVQAERLLTKAVDSVEDRMGQVNYDNWFWDKRLRGTAHLAITAVGWRGGTLRHVGGAVLDLTKQMKAILTGKTKDMPIEIKGMSQRQGWTIAGVGLTAFYSGLYQYLHTGIWPASLRDYMFPKTGHKAPDGTDERSRIPGYFPKDVSDIARVVYTGDVLDVVRGPYEWAKSGESPLLILVPRVWQAVEGSPAGERVRAIWTTLGEEALPLSVKRTQQAWSEGAERRTEAMMGITPARSWTRRSEGLQQTRDILRRRMDEYTSPAEREKYTLKGKAQEKVRSGKFTIQDIKDWQKAGLFKDHAGARRFLTEAKMTPLQRSFSSLTMDERKQVWPSLSPKEKAEVGRYMHSKPKNTNSGLGGLGSLPGL